MTWIDIILLTIIICLIIHGILIGLIRGLFDIVAITIGYILAINFSDAIRIPKYLAFLLIFVIAVIVVSILGRLLSKLIRVTPLGVADRILGGVLGFLKGFIVGFIFLIIILLLQKENRILYKSMIAHRVIKVGLTASQVLPAKWYKWIEKVITQRAIVLDNEDYHLYL